MSWRVSFFFPPAGPPQIPQAPPPRGRRLPPPPPPPLPPPRVGRGALPGGGWLLRSRDPLAPHAPRVTDSLWYWAAAAPDRPFLRERGPDGAWRGATYAE